MLTKSVFAAQRPGGTPTQSQPPPQQQQQPTPHGYPPPYPPTMPLQAPPQAAMPYQVPQPSNSGSIDLSNIKPVSSGSVSLADAVAKARGIAAEKGVPYGSRGGGSQSLTFLLVEHTWRLTSARFSTNPGFRSSSNVPTLSITLEIANSDTAGISRQLQPIS